jgi:hypothetical protein
MTAKPFLSLLLFGALLPTAAPQQDLNFRLMNLERRVDQLQNRLDYVERNQQTQALTPTTTNQYNHELVLELQRQQLSLAQQVVQQDKRILELQKTIDRLVESQSDKKTKEGTPAKPEESAKPKSAPRRP